METFIVYMPKIAKALSKKGFKIIEVIPNPKKPQYQAFVFEKTQEFLLAFTQIAND